MVSTSVTSGTLASSSGSALSSAAAICGSAAFFAPQIWTEPSMRLPPRMTNRSMLFLLGLAAIANAAPAIAPAVMPWVFGVSYLRLDSLRH